MIKKDRKLKIVFILKPRDTFCKGLICICNDWIGPLFGIRVRSLHIVSVNLKFILKKFLFVPKNLLKMKRFTLTAAHTGQITFSESTENQFLSQQLQLDAVSR